MKFLSLLALASLTSFSALSADNLILLDLQNATTPLEFDSDNGAWTETYSEDETALESQCFSFVHNAIEDWQTWWGFTASVSADNSFRTNFIKYQFSNMNMGGIMLDEDGSIALDEFGAPKVSAAVPYLVAFYSPYMAARPVNMTFNTGKSYEAVGLYMNLNSYTYYSIQNGDGIARAFTNGDKFTISIFGVKPDGTESSVDVDLASYSNGDITINKGWRYVDISSLGIINELYFKISTTDIGTYGDNTPAYFCIDKLMVKDTDPTAVRDLKLNSDSNSITYNRSMQSIKLAHAGFAVIFDATGNQIASFNDSQFCISHLPAGVYVIKSGNNSLKIAR